MKLLKSSFSYETEVNKIQDARLKLNLLYKTNKN